jgi:hypothetical protein
MSQPILVSKDAADHEVLVLQSPGRAPSVDDRARVAEFQKLKQLREEHRITAVREAYWQHSDINGVDFIHLYNALAESGLADQPTDAQVRALFMALPASILGQGIAWGFCDTEVRDSVVTFVTENRLQLARALGIV